MKIKLATLIIFTSVTLLQASQTIYMHAHRGESSLAPQNTPESLKLAYDLGARMIETDFHLTNEGIMVCMHGRNELKELWGIDKNPHELTLSEIRSSRLVKPEKFDVKYANCKIPTIDEIFAVIPKDKSFELEIKKYGEAFADKVEVARKKAGLDYKNILVTSFDPNVIKDFKKKYPQYETLYILSYDEKKGYSPEKIIATAKDAGASQVAIGNYRKIDRNVVETLQKSGLKVGVWQVNTLNDLIYAHKLGVNRICSDYASRLRNEYNQMKDIDLK